MEIVKNPLFSSPLKTTINYLLRQYLNVFPESVVSFVKAIWFGPKKCSVLPTAKRASQGRRVWTYKKKKKKHGSPRILSFCCSVSLVMIGRLFVCLIHTLKISPTFHFFTIFAYAKFLGKTLTLLKFCSAHISRQFISLSNATKIMKNIEN